MSWNHSFLVNSQVFFSFLFFFSEWIHFLGKRLSQKDKSSWGTVINALRSIFPRV